MNLRRIVLIVSIFFMSVAPMELAAAAPLARPLALTLVPETLSLGDAYSCALRSDSTLNCWGAVPPGAPAASTQFTQISAGGAHMCGILTTPASGNNLLCWGDNNFGQTTVPAGMYSQVSAGWEHTCAVKSDASLACWGAGTVAPVPNTGGEFGQSIPPAGNDFAQVTVGAVHSCALHTDGSLVCWGSNAGGKAPPTSSGIYSQVDAGYNFTCAIHALDDPVPELQGVVWCGGAGPVGETVMTDDTYTQISVGYYHSCGLLTGGTVRCWGDNLYGETGPTPAVSTFVQVAAGQDHSCGQRSAADGGAWVCWGRNNNLQCDTYAISGNAGTGGAQVTFAGGPTVSSDSLGRYVLPVPGEWSGTVTISKTGYTFSPSSMDYPTAIADNITGQDYAATAIIYNVTFTSQSSFDGAILESAMGKKVGGTMNKTGIVFQLGDDVANRQYRAVLSFKTSSLPDNANITAAVVKILRSGTAVGRNPFSIFGKLWVDIHKGPFLMAYLQTADFSAPASSTKVGYFGVTPVASWYSAPLNLNGRAQINRSSALSGLTQMRLWFTIPSNKNNKAEFMKFFSGEAGAAKAARLLVTYMYP